jgi:hypothetical protein
MSRKSWPADRRPLAVGIGGEPDLGKSTGSVQNEIFDNDHSEFRNETHLARVGASYRF